MESLKNPASNIQHFKKIRFFGTRHVQALLLFTGNKIAFGMRTCMSVAIVAMTDNESSKSNVPAFHWDSLTQSYILSSLLWGALVAQLPMSFLVRNGGSHRLFYCSFFMCSIVSILTPVLTVKFNWIALLICRITMGVCQGCLTPCLIMLLAKWVPPIERATLGSFVLNSQELGNVISLALSGVLAASNFGWPSIFYTFGSAGILWSIVFFWLGADSPSTHKHIHANEREYIENSFRYSDDDIMDNKNIKIPWRAIMTSLPVWSILCTRCAHLWSYYMLLSEMPTFMKSILKFDIAQSGTISSLPYVAKWLFAFPIGWASDFALRKSVSITLVRKISNSIGMWGPCITLLLLCVLRTTNQTVAVILLILTVGFNAGTMCGQEINEIDICPNFSGIVATITNSFGKIFGIMAPIAFGFIVTDFKSIDQWLIIYYISVVLYFFGNLAFVIFGKGEIQFWNNESPLNHPRGEQSSPNLSVEENVFRLSIISKLSSIRET